MSASTLLLSLFQYKAWANEELFTELDYHRGAVGRIMAQVAVPPPRDIFTLYLHQSEPARRG